VRVKCAQWMPFEWKSAATYKSSTNQVTIRYLGPNEHCWLGTSTLREVTPFILTEHAVNEDSKEDFLLLRWR
jgi:hypothetical protein